MRDRNLANVAASVHQRLINRSRETGEDFQFLLQRYAAERFLYRLGVSSHRHRFVLKGAMLFALWGGSVYRATRDLDFTGYGDSSDEAVRQCFREICAQPVEDDGLEFDTSTIRVEPILDEAEYNGVRVRFEARLGSARIPMQVDVGFGNAIEPVARDEEYPTLLGGPRPWIRTYPVEAVVAEKLHAIHRFGETNSRLKDFYDLYVLSEQFEFYAQLLQRAVAATFERRGTPIVSTLPAGLQPRFFADDARAGQWRAYLSRNGLPGAPADLQAIGERLRAFLGPIWDGIAKGSLANGTWHRGNGWSSGETSSGAGTVPRAAVECIPQVSAPHVSAGGGPPAATPSSPIEATATSRLGRFKRYPAYKDSGVEWLGAIPAHWEIVRLKRVCTLAYGEALPGEARGDGDIEVYGSNGPVGTHGQANTLAPCLVIGRKGSFGKVNFSYSPVFAIDTTFFVDRRFTKADIRWLYYVLIDARLDRATKDSAVPGLDREDAYAREVCLCPSSEQRAIAAFLDRETAKIDALVEKKERLIALLQEKRTALVSHAVTKGLDPSVPMKDSGVEWLGAIPAHWEVKPLKFTVTMNPDVLDEATRPDYEMLYVDVGNVDSIGTIQNAESVRFEDAPTRARRKVRTGDTILSTVRTYLKAIAFVNDPPDNLIVSTGFAVLRPGRNVAPKFLWRLVQSQQFVDAVVSYSEGVGYPAINPSRLGRLVAWLPPLPEQRAIAAFLDRETAKIDALIAKVREAIERLKEYRTALISAAVTGKIKAEG